MVVYKYCLPLVVLLSVESALMASDYPYRGARTARQTREAPECAKGRTFCDGDVKDYPTDVIEKLVSQNFSQWDRFNKKDILTKEEQKVAQLARMVEEDIELCKTRVGITDIKQVKMGDGSWAFVVQSSKLRQVLRFELCVDRGAPCSHLVTDGLPRSYKSECKQKYIVRQDVLLLNNSAPPSLYPSNVRVPSCCACVLHVNTKGEDVRLMGGRIPVGAQA